METPQETGSNLRRQTVRRVRQAGKALLASINPDLSKIPLEEINEGTVARTIYGQIGAPQMRFRDPWANLFTIVDVLANMGYVGTWANTDYWEKFSEEYRVTRAVLQRLVHNKILEMVAALSNPNKEDISYKVIQPDLLRELGVKASEETAKTHA